MISLLLIAISLSIDSIGVGFTYGMKKIKLPILSRFLMSLLSFFCGAISISLGSLLSITLPTGFGEYLSILILAFMGFYMLISSIRELHTDPSSQKIQKQWALNFFGLTITIIKKPLRGDLDHSNVIEPYEAILIGLALSLDSIGAGVGYAINSGSVLLFPLFISIFQFLFLSLGYIGGCRFRKGSIYETFISFLPGIIMICLAITRLLLI